MLCLKLAHSITVLNFFGLERKRLFKFWAFPEAILNFKSPSKFNSTHGHGECTCAYVPSMHATHIMMAMASSHKIFN